LRLFAGDSGFAAEVTSSGLLGGKLGSGGSWWVSDCDCKVASAAGVDVPIPAGSAVLVDEESRVSGGGDRLAFCTGTVGSNGSIGEY
jgi:hypothetical protein